MRRIMVIGLAVLLAGTTACGPNSKQATAKAAPVDSSELTRRAQRLVASLAAVDSDAAPDAPLAQWVLPHYLHEISGLAFTSDGRMLTHGDQRGRVFEVDYRRGVVVKEFRLGHDSLAIKGDFEGITVVGDTVFLLESNGKLYVFHEGANGESVDYTVHDTGLGKTCEFESVTFAKAINSLLLACKNVHDKTFKDSLVIFRWKLQGDSATRLTHFTIPLKTVIGANPWQGLHPSDITIDPANGNYVLIASREQALFEITPAGKLVFARALPGEHPQAEGIAITGDGVLVISDEGGNAKKPPLTRPAVITLYRWH